MTICVSDFHFTVYTLTSSKERVHFLKVSTLYVRTTLIWCLGSPWDVKIQIRDDRNRTPESRVLTDGPEVKTGRSKVSRPFFVLSPGRVETVEKFLGGIVEKRM